MKLFEEPSARYDSRVPTLQQLHGDVLYELLPPSARRLLGRPLLDVELTQTTGQVHDRHGDDLRLPLERKHGAQAGERKVTG